MKKLLFIPILLTTGCLNSKQLPNRVVKNPDKFKLGTFLELEHTRGYVWELEMTLEKPFIDKYGQKMVLKRHPEDPNKYVIQSINQ